MRTTYKERCSDILKRINQKIDDDVRLGNSNGMLYVYTRTEDGGEWHAPFEFSTNMRKPKEMLEYLSGVEEGINLIKRRNEKIY